MPWQGLANTAGSARLFCGHRRRQQRWRGRSPSLPSLSPVCCRGGGAQEAAEGELKGILGYETRPLVSTDYINEARSGVVDAACTQVVDGTLVKVYAW